MPTNPSHGYLTEPRWFTARNTSLTSLRTWADLAAKLTVIATVLVVIMIIAR